MKRILFSLASIIAAVAILSCSRQSIREGRSNLRLLYLTHMPSDADGWAGLQDAVLQMKEKPLVVVDDNRWTSVSDLCWWEGEKELFLLEQAGCDMFFPPASWLVLGPERLKELSSRADFFIIALDITDEQQSYPLSRYMIRRQSPYSAVFSAGIRDHHRRLDGFHKLPLDSILQVTSSFVLMQADFFMFFTDEKIDTSLSERAHRLDRGGENRIMDFRFVSRVDFKVKEKGFGYQPAQASIIDPLTRWEAYVDTLESEVVGSTPRPLSADSLNRLATEAARELARELTGSDRVTVIAADSLISGGVDAGEITMGRMRDIMSAEVFFLVDAAELEGVLFNRGTPDQSTVDREWAVVPSSVCLEDERFSEIPLRVTGITSARITRHMFADKLPTEEDK